MQVQVTTASDRAGQRGGGGQGAGFPTEPALGARGELTVGWLRLVMFSRSSI